MEPCRSESNIDETLAESFPASDPPSWTLGGAPAAPRIADTADAEPTDLDEPTVDETVGSAKRGCPV